MAADACFSLPIRPYSPVDALNRRAAALGSPAYAQATSYADYNGHAISVSYNDYRGYYVTQYYYGERVVLARGAFDECLRAALREYGRGTLGCSVVICPKPGDTEAVVICESTAGLLPGSDAATRNGSWYTWRHKVAASCARDSANPHGSRRIFDLDLLNACESEDDYDKQAVLKHGRAWVA